VLPPNPTPGSVVGEVPEHKGVSRVAFTSDGKRAYVTNTERNSVAVLDIATAKITAEITVGVAPVGIAILPDNSRAYVANSGSDDFSVIDIDPNSPTFHQVVKTIKVGDQPLDVVVTAGGPKVWVANYKSGDVSVIDANKDNGTYDQVVKTVSVGSGCASITITADEGRIYAGIGTGVVYVDLNSPDQVVKTISAGSGCVSITLTADQTIVLALLSDGTLLVISASPGSSFNQVVKTVSTGSGATSVTVSADEAVAYVTSADGNVVFVYEIHSSDLPSASSSAPGPAITLTLIGTIHVGLSPSDLAINPAGGQLGLVTNTGDGTITIINFAATEPPIVVEFDFDPNSVDLKKMDGRVKGYIEPPAPYLAADILVSSIRFNHIVPVDMTHPPKLEDHIHHPGEHVPDLKVEFQRGPVGLTLLPGKKVGGPDQRHDWQPGLRGLRQHQGQGTEGEEAAPDGNGQSARALHGRVGGAG
jgi:YVTN family beta-propeller protein